VFKQEGLPFYELVISRKATFDELLKTISATYKEMPKKGRLWIEDEMIGGGKLNDRIEDFGISIGQVVYVEYSDQNNVFPTDLNRPSSLKSQPSSQSHHSHTQGLYNLGNTCYMNSALQCLANTKHFKDYFCGKKYLKQMNMKSRLGY